MERLGSPFMQPEDLNALNVIHITGTKGKGSTSAFVERICRERFIEKGYFGDGGVSKLRNKEEEGDDDLVEGGDEEWYGGIGELRRLFQTGNR